MTIGFVICDLAMPSYLAAVPVAQEVAEGLGYTLFIADSRLDRDIERRGIETFLDLNVDGLLWTPILPIDARSAGAVKGRPAVVVASFSEPFPCVTPEIGPSTLEAVRNLLAIGHKRFGLVSLRGLASAENAFIRSFRTVLDEGGATLVSRGDWTFHDRTQCLEAMSQRFDSSERPTALLVHSPLIPPTVLAARRAGLRIPEDLSVVAIGDSEFAECFNPPIDAIAWDYRRVAETAVRLLIDLIDGKSPETARTLLPSQLLKRGSVGPGPRVRTVSR
jgi:LacI family transcriptional regulator